MIVAGNKTYVRFFYILLALALLARLVSDVFVIHRWGIHSGELFPYRRGMPSVPLYSQWVLLLEWSTIFLASILLLRNYIRWGIFLATVGMAFSLSQMFQNQKLLILIVLITLWIEPMTLKNEKESASKVFLKWQLVLVYFFSAVHKIIGGFSHGDVLQLIFEKILKLPFSLNQLSYMAISWAVIVAELVAPVLLMYRPRAGFAFVVILHVGMSLVMPDILSFSLIMMALAILYSDQSNFFSKST